MRRDWIARRPRLSVAPPCGCLRSSRRRSQLVLVSSGRAVIIAYPGTNYADQAQEALTALDHPPTPDEKPADGRERASQLNGVVGLCW
jgi:hypothetical protein